MPMEMLPINNNGGQGYGFILYRRELQNAPWEITIFNIRDSAQVTNGSKLQRVPFAGDFNTFALKWYS